MMQCVLVLAILYFALYFMLATLRLLRRVRYAMRESHRHHRWEEARAWDMPASGRSLNDGEAASQWNPIEQREAQAWAQHGLERSLEQATLTLHFAPMLCILLVCIQMRVL